jgi:hypothetical protein
MKKSIVFFILLAAFVGLNSCLKENCNCDPVSDQPVLFQYEYYNNAWGFNHYGFLIDNDGKIHDFHKPKDWISPDSAGMITKDGLEHNLAQCDTVSGTVDKDDLKDWFEEVEYLRDGKIVDTGVYMADAGEATFSAWYWNKKESKYENVFIVSSGDQNEYNDNVSLSKVVKWLREIGSESSRFFWYGGL